MLGQRSRPVRRALRAGRRSRRGPRRAPRARRPRRRRSAWRARPPSAGAAQLLAEVGPRGVERRLHLLRAAGDVDQPARVAEVPFDLAQDRRRGVGGELQPPVGIEAVDCLDQTDGADLDEVVERLVAAGEASGEIDDERQVRADELVAQRLLGRAVLGERVSSTSRAITSGTESPSVLSTPSGGSDAVTGALPRASWSHDREPAVGVAHVDARWRARRAPSRRTRSDRCRRRPRWQRWPGPELARASSKSGVEGSRSVAWGRSSAQASSTASRRSSMSSTVRSQRAARLAAVEPERRHVADVGRHADLDTSPSGLEVSGWSRAPPF